MFFHIHFLILLLKQNSIYHDICQHKLHQNLTNLKLFPSSRKLASHPLQARVEPMNEGYSISLSYHRSGGHWQTTTAQRCFRPEASRNQCCKLLLLGKPTRRRKNTGRKSVLFRFNATSWFNQFVPHQTILLLLIFFFAFCLVDKVVGKSQKGRVWDEVAKSSLAPSDTVDFRSTLIFGWEKLRIILHYEYVRFLVWFRWSFVGHILGRKICWVEYCRE